MQILNVSPKELDYVAMLCVDPGLSSKMRKEVCQDGTRVLLHLDFFNNSVHGQNGWLTK